MKFGVFDHMDREQADLSRQYAERLRLIEAYDRGGLYAYHLAEHHGTPLGLAPSPSVFLAAAAQHSERLRLGALVYTLPQYHPLRLAEELCMLDQLSRGRLELGIGRGISPIELGFYGLSGEEASERFGECRDVVLAAMGTDRLNFHGTHYQFDDVPIVLRPFQQPHPPLWYGVSKTSTCAWAAANDVNVATNGPPSAVRVITDAYRAEWAKLGKPEAALPLLGVNRHIVVADSDEEAFEIARVAYPVWLGSLLLLWREHGVDPGIRFPQTAAEAVEAGFVFAGTAARVRESIAELVAATGVNYLLCRFAFGSMPVEASLRSVAIFVDEVVPAFE